MHKLGSKRARWPGYVDSTYKCAVWKLCRKEEKAWDQKFKNAGSLRRIKWIGLKWIRIESIERLLLRWKQILDLHNTCELVMWGVEKMWSIGSLSRRMKKYAPRCSLDPNEFVLNSSEIWTQNKIFYFIKTLKKHCWLGIIKKNTFKSSLRSLR
jgi:hypothetical protein